MLTAATTSRGAAQQVEALVVQVRDIKAIMALRG